MFYERLSIYLFFTLVCLIIYLALQGLCHALAVEKGVSHAQLPISEYLDMKTRKVLTINHGI